MIVHAITRPQVIPYTRWTGDNQAELEAHYGVQFTVAADGALVRPSGSIFPDTSPVPEGYWFSNCTMRYLTDEQFTAGYQLVDAESPYEFTITGS